MTDEKLKCENRNLKSRSVKIGIYQQKLENQKLEKFCAEIKKLIIENNTPNLRTEKRKREKLDFANRSVKILCDNCNFDKTTAP